MVSPGLSSRKYFGTLCFKHTTDETCLLINTTLDRLQTQVGEMLLKSKMLHIVGVIFYLNASIEHNFNKAKIYMPTALVVHQIFNYQIKQDDHWLDDPRKSISRLNQKVLK